MKKILLTVFITLSFNTCCPMNNKAKISQKILKERQKVQSFYAQESAETDFRRAADYGNFKEMDICMLKRHARPYSFGDYEVIQETIREKNFKVFAYLLTKYNMYIELLKTYDGRYIKIELNNLKEEDKKEFVNSIFKEVGLSNLKNKELSKDLSNFLFKTDNKSFIKSRLSILEWAIENDKIKLVDALLKQSKTIRGVSPAHVAAAKGKISMLKHLKKQGIDPLEKRRYLDRWLLPKDIRALGFDIGSYEIVSSTSDNYEGEKPIEIAALCADPNTIKTLKKLGAPENNNDLLNFALLAKKHSNALYLSSIGTIWNSLNFSHFNNLSIESKEKFWQHCCDRILDLNKSSIQNIPGTKIEKNIAITEIKEDLSKEFSKNRNTFYTIFTNTADKIDLHSDKPIKMTSDWHGFTISPRGIFIQNKTRMLNDTMDDKESQTEECKIFKNKLKLNLAQTEKNTFGDIELFCHQNSTNQNLAYQTIKKRRLNK